MGRKNIITQLPEKPKSNEEKPNNIRNEKKEFNLAKKYYNLPFIKTNKKYIITNIESINFNYQTNKTLPFLKYKYFTQLDTLLHPKKNNTYDLSNMSSREAARLIRSKESEEPHEDVSPVIIHTTEGIFKVNETVWFALNDISYYMTRLKNDKNITIYPFTVLIDEGNRWVSIILNKTQGFGIDFSIS